MYKLRPIIISGPSGSGKDTIIKKLIQNNPFMYDALGYTTRNPRNTETNGVDMFFVSKKEFQDMIDDNKFIEYTQYSGNYYGMPFSEIEKSNNRLTLFNVGVSAANVIKEYNKESISILILPPSKEELLLRLGDRGKERFDRAKADILYASTFFDYLVISRNDNVDLGVSEIEKIIFENDDELDINKFKDFIENFFN